VPEMVLDVQSIPSLFYVRGLHEFIVARPNKHKVINETKVKLSAIAKEDTAVEMIHV
jgi:hypothetical protein